MPQLRVPDLHQGEVGGASDSDDPPPPYEASSRVNDETSLEYGPIRPFQPTSQDFPVHQFFSRPSAAAGIGGSGSSLPPPRFPFWNGASLTPAQTGFSDGPMHGPHPTFGSQFSPLYHGHSSYPQSSTPASQSSFHPSPSSSWSPQPQQPNSFSPPRLPLGAHKYSPSNVPIPGQPYLRNQQLLVYPTSEMCWKCRNTGYKQNDPNHPCRKCWDKYGKPYQGSLKFAAETTWPPAPNYQRPLPNLDAPLHQPVPGGYPASARPFTSPNIFHGPPTGGGGVLVLQPGDPRMGGQLCNLCGGSGQVVSGLFFLDQTTCYSCRGAGRVYY